MPTGAPCGRSLLTVCEASERFSAAASTLTISNDDFWAKRALWLDNESLDPGGEKQR